jgi:hypothetical protein
VELFANERDEQSLQGEVNAGIPGAFEALRRLKGNGQTTWLGRLDSVWVTAPVSTLTRLQASGQRPFVPGRPTIEK